MRLAAKTQNLKRKRSSKADLEVMYERLRDIISEQAPCTVRQVFYRATVAGIGPKEERFYDRVGRYLVHMRESEMIPFGHIADNTRWMRKPDSYSSLGSMLEETKILYRRALWRDQNAYVEVWLEKDALSGVIYDVTSEWDVPLMVTRGYASLSFLHDAAEAIAREHRPVHIYYFGDYDPSGIDIPKQVEARLRQYAPGAEIRFKRVAVNPEQIRALNLPARPTKKTDSRSKTFEGQSVEVDAIEPNLLRDMAREVIQRHIDPRALEQTRLVEESERSALNMFIRKWSARKVELQD
jgi:hypothetical protein